MSAETNPASPTPHKSVNDLLVEAMLWRHGMEMKRQNEAIAFVRFAIQKVNETKLAQ